MILHLLLPPPPAVKTTMVAQAQPLQSISIPRFELRSASGSALPAHSGAGGSTAPSSASSYYVFAVVVKLPVRSWTVYRRYSEFARLDKCLAASSSAGSGAEPGGAGKPAPRALPPKQRAREWKRTWSSLSTLPSSFLASFTASNEPNPQQQQEWEEQQVFLRDRQAELERYLKAILMHPDPVWRESEAFKTFIEWPLSVKMTTVPPPTAPSTAKSTVPPKPPVVSTPPRAPVERNSVRTLGTPTPSAPVEETSFTRAQDNTQLFNSQTAAMDQQDEQLLNLAAVLRRQRTMGEAINQELAEHTDLLTQLDDEVSHTQANLARADAKMDRFDGGKAKNKLGIGRKF